MINIIAAVSSDGFIGRHGMIPWRLPSDIDHFKNLTIDHTVIMGRKTWKSIPEKVRPLPYRKNIVLTRQKDFDAPGAIVLHSLEEALESTSEDKDVFIIGGGEIYKQAMRFAEKIILTEVGVFLQVGDTRFPPYPSYMWNLVYRSTPIQNEKDEFPFQIAIYNRITK